MCHPKKSGNSEIWNWLIYHSYWSILRPVFLLTINHQAGLRAYLLMWFVACCSVQPVAWNSFGQSGSDWWATTMTQKCCGWPLYKAWHFTNSHWNFDCLHAKNAVNSKSRSVKNNIYRLLGSEIYQWLSFESQIVWESLC